MLLMIRYLLCIILLSSIAACSSRARLEMKTKNISKSQLSQHYSNLTQHIYCGEEPIVRFINFTFDKNDSLQITVDITTSLAEKQLSGDFSILVDEYEIEYAGLSDTRLYLETLEIESQARYPNHFIGSQSVVSVLARSAVSKNLRKDSKEQYWNTLSVIIEPQDEIIMMTSEDIIFSVKTKKCELLIYPTKKQITELKRFLD